MRPFIPKDNQELPDSYKMKIFFNAGGIEEHEVAMHKIIKESEVIEFVSSEDRWFIVPLCSIKKIEFDKNFSKIVALKNETIIQEQRLKEVSNGN